MDMPWRGILFYSFVLFFLISSLVVLLYGTGYRYNASKRMIEKTGELIVGSRPKGATVFLDGKAIGVTAPLHEKYILPGRYLLTLRKEGYLPFVRDITISSGIVSIASDIVLVRDETPLLLFSNVDPIEEIFSATPHAVFFRTKKAISIFDREKRETRELLRTAEDIAIAVSPSKKSFYGYAGQKSYVIQADTRKIISGRLPPSGITGSLVWSDRQELYAITRKGIIAYDPTAGTAEYIARGSFLDLMLLKDFLYAIEKNGNKTYLVRLRAKDPRDKMIRTQIPDDVIEFIKDTEFSFAFRNRNEEVSLFNEEGLMPQEFFREIKKLVFSAEENFIAASEFEVWIFEGKDKKEKRLLLRQSDPILKASLIPGTPYAFIASAHAAEVVETQDHPAPNRYEIFRSTKLTSSVLLPDEKKALFIVTEQKGSHVFERLLAD